MWTQRLKAKVLHSLKGMLVEGLFSIFLALVTLLLTIFFHLLLT